jgi:phage terminase large subunit GpA-like protein
MLSAEGSAEPGRWRTERAEYQRGIMDAFNNPNVEQITIMSSSGVGKTEILLNFCGYIIDHDPSTMLIVQPTLEMGMAWSKDRYTPMTRDSFGLADKVSEPRSKDGENTILHKIFTGGHITIAGANSSASLASRHVRIVMLDEVDRYPSSVGNVGRTSAAGGGEGDPVKLAIKRTITYSNRKIIATSTPTVAGASRIESLFNISAKHFYFVPCTKCGYFQVLKFVQIKFKHDKKKVLEGTVYYECEKCLAKLGEADKVEMVRRGEWRTENDSERMVGERGGKTSLESDISTNPRKREGENGVWRQMESVVEGASEQKRLDKVDTRTSARDRRDDKTGGGMDKDERLDEIAGKTRGETDSIGLRGQDATQVHNPGCSTFRHIGFHISELYSPWSTWERIVEDFLESKDKKETYRVWKNTTLGETYEETESYVIDRIGLMARVEMYQDCPVGVLFLTAGVDVQKDRLEVVVKGFGLKDESWLIDRKRIYAQYGSTLNESAWNELLKFLSREFKHERGVSLKVACVCIDSGYQTPKAYEMVKKWSKLFSFIYAVKGMSGGANREFLSKVNVNNKYRAKMVMLGVDQGKRMIHDRLLLEDGEGQMHFNESCDEEYFEQLTAEKQVTVYSKGFATKVWQLVEKGRRNEAFDCEVYALAAKELLAPDWEKIQKNFEIKVSAVKQAPEKIEEREIEQVERRSKPFRSKRAGGYSVNGWRV